MAVLASRTKFGSISPHLVAPLTDLDAVASADPSLTEALQAAGLPGELQASNAWPDNSSPGERLSPRQAHTGAYPDGRLDRHRACMSLGDRLDDREAEPGTTVTAALRFADLPALSEPANELVGRFTATAADQRWYDGPLRAKPDRARP